MSRTLVTIICNKDRWGVELLCRTMDKYLDPCNVIFILNEDDETSDILNQWFQEMCMPHLIKKFNVKLYRKFQFWNIEDECHLTPLEKEGWVDQQVLKLAVYKKIQTDDYVVLDSKNFFVRPCRCIDIKQISPEPTDWCEPILKNWITTCIETFNFLPPEKALRLTQNTTPYIIRKQSAKDLINYFGGISSFYKWFTIEARKDKHSPAEFFLYEIFTITHGWRNLGDCQQNCISMWEHMIIRDKMTQQDFVKYFIHMFRTYDVKVAGLHKGLFKYWSHQEGMFILKRLGVYDCIPKTVSPFSAK